MVAARIAGSALAQNLHAEGPQRIGKELVKLSRSDNMKIAPNKMSSSHSFVGGSNLGLS